MTMDQDRHVLQTISHLAVVAAHLAFDLEDGVLAQGSAWDDLHFLLETIQFLADSQAGPPTRPKIL
jgi:hypothetical protein